MSKRFRRRGPRLPPKPAPPISSTGSTTLSPSVGAPVTSSGNGRQRTQARGWLPGWPSWLSLGRAAPAEPLLYSSRRPHTQGASAGSSTQTHRVRRSGVVPRHRGRTRPSASSGDRPGTAAGTAGDATRGLSASKQETMERVDLVFAGFAPRTSEYYLARVSLRRAHSAACDVLNAVRLRFCACWEFSCCCSLWAPTVNCLF